MNVNLKQWMLFCGGRESLSVNPHGATDGLWIRINRDVSGLWKWAGFGFVLPGHLKFTCRVIRSSMTNVFFSFINNTCTTCPGICKSFPIIHLQRTRSCKQSMFCRLLTEFIYHII